MPRDCAVLFTHQWSPALARHVDRLRREASGTLDVFVALHAEPGKPVPAGMNPDFTVGLADMKPRAPFRTAALERLGWEVGWVGYIDLIWLAALLHDRVAAYDRLWFIEYDVDLDGDWGRFFAAASGYAGDLLMTRLRRLSQHPEWYHAPRLALPATVTDPLIGLFCIARLSRPLIEAYVSAVASPGWDGHFEAVLPSFAESAGFSVAEISGRGTWTPPDRTDLHYTGTWSDMSSAQTTYSFRPPHAYRYFVDRRSPPGDRDTLYHPVKIDVPLLQRLRFTEQDLRWGLRARLGMRPS